MIEEYIYKGLGIRLVCSVLQETRSFSSYMAARKFLTPLSHSLLTFTLDANPKSQARHSTFRRQLAPSLEIYICERIKRFEGLPPSVLAPLALWGAWCVQETSPSCESSPILIRATWTIRPFVSPCPRIHHHIPWCIFTQRRGHVGNHIRMTLYMEEILLSDNT